RPWLLAEAKARNLVYADQIELPISTPIYPLELEQWAEVKQGLRAFIRPLRLTDESAMRDMFYKLSPESIYHRFFQPLRSMPHPKIQQFMRIDYQNDMVLVASTGKGEADPLIAVGRYNLDHHTNMAEVAFLVRDDWQNRGLGTALLKALIESAKAHGIQGFTAEVLADNQPMLRVFHKAELAIESKLHEGVYTLHMLFKSEA
ncbi:MAG: GNAT family N-acetyltransferase, partial [Phycisphaerales bacterium]